MTLPQQNINYFQALTETPRPSQVIEFPKKLSDGSSFEVALCMLTASETAQSAAWAEQQSRKYLKENTPVKGEESKGYDRLFNDFCSVAILWYSTKMKDNLKQSFFPTKESILDTLSVDEIGILISNYYTLQLLKGPVIARMDENEQKVWIERIIKDGASSAFFLNLLTSQVQSQLLIAMGSQLKSYVTDTSLSTEQPKIIS